MDLRIKSEENPEIAAVAKREVVITRLFDAPRELVFKAWTNPQMLLRWFAPNGCSIYFNKIDIRPGGFYHSCIRNPNAHDCWCIGVYHEIVIPKRIVYSVIIADEEGNPADPGLIGMDPEWPRETKVTINFEELDGKTNLTLCQTVEESLAKRTGAFPSWIQMLDRLTSDLAGN